MSERQSSLTAIERPRCQARMPLVATEPGLDGFDHRTFNCAKWGERWLGGACSRPRLLPIYPLAPHLDTPPPHHSCPRSHPTPFPTLLTPGPFTALSAVKG